MKGSELRAQFIKDAAPIVKSITNTGQGLPDDILDVDNPDFEPINYVRTWELAKDIIASSTDILKIEVRTTEGIVNAVCQGKINLNEAKELMALLQSKQNIEELPGLLQKIEELENG